MSDFTAKFQAILDTSKIPSQIASIEKTPIKLSKITLDTKNLPSQIQASLDGHNFTIKLDGIKMANINSQANQAGRSYSQAFADGVRTQLSNGGIEASIARVTAQYEKLATSGHGYLSKVATDLQHLNDLHNDLATNTGDNTALVNTYKRFSETLTNVRNNLITVSSQTKSIASQSQIEALGSKMTTWMRNNTAASSKYGSTIDSLQQQLKALGVNAPISELNRIAEAFEQIKSQASAAGLVGDSFSASIKKSFKNISSYISIASVLRQSVEVCREMAENVLAIDTAMTGLYRVTSLTNAQYKQLYNNMAQSAKDYGSELTTIIDATTNWTKLGFEVNVAKQLAEVTTMYQQVADLDTKTAVNNLVTAYKGYEKQLLALTGGDTVAAVEYIADVFNKLGNEFAVEAFDIGAALNNSASALEVAGNTMQQSAGMATGIIEVTQDASRAGSALRTLSMRLRGTTAEELEAIGEDAEGLIVVTSKMHATIKKLTGVDLVDANGQLRSTYEVMDDIAHVWDSLDPNTQANVLETIAGKNRASDIQALINNWESVEAAVKSATDATGTARKEYEVFLESLQAHLNRIETAWQKLSYSFMDVGLLETGADVLVGILDTLDGIVNTLGSTGTVSVGAGIFAVIKNVDGIKKFAQEVIKAENAWAKFGSGLKSFIGTPAGIATSLGLLVTAISAVVQIVKHNNEQQAAMRQKLIDTGLAAIDEYKSISELYNRYVELGNITRKGRDVREEFISVSEDLREALGLEQVSIETLIDKYGNLSTAIHVAAQEAIEKSKSEMSAGLTAAEDEILATFDNDLSWSSKGIRLRFEVPDGEEIFAQTLNSAEFDWSDKFKSTNYNTRADISLGGIETIEDALAIYHDIETMMEVLRDGASKGLYSEDKLRKSGLYGSLYNLYSEYKDLFDKRQEFFDGFNLAATKQLYNDYVQTKGVPQNVEDLKLMRESLIETAIASGQFVGSQEEIRTSVINALAQIPALANLFDEYTSQLENAASVESPKYSFATLIADTDDDNDFIDRINTYREKVEYLQDTLAKLRDGKLTSDDQIDLIAAYPELDADNLEAGIVETINDLKGVSGDAATGIMAIFDEMYAQIDPTDTESLAQFENFKALILSLFDTVAEGTPVFENLSDAISGVSDASDLIATIREEMAENGQISLGTLEKMAKEFGSDVSDYFTFEDGKILPQIDKIKTYYENAIVEMGLENKDLEDSLIDALSNGFDAGKFKFDSITDAMSKAQEVASLAAGAQKDIAFDTVESLREIFGQGYEDYIITDEAGNFVSANVEALREYARGLLETRNASDATLAEFDAMWQSTLDGTKEAETALDRVSKALSNVGDVSSYLTLLESDDLTFVEALEQAVKLLEAMGDGYSLDDFFTFSDSGDITYHTEFLTTWLDTYLDKVVEAGDISEDFADQMKAVAKAETEQVNAIEKLTDAMSQVEKASDLIATAQEEIEKNGKNSIGTVMSLYEQFGDKANTMFTPSGDGGFIINTNLVKQEMYALIDTIEAASPEIKQAMKDALDVEMEEEAFEDVVDEYVSKVETLKETLETLRSDGKLSDSALYDLIKDFPELATETDNLEQAITNLIGTMNTDIVAEFEKQFGKVDSAEDVAELQAFMDIVLKLGEVVGTTQFAIDINAEADGMQNLFDAIKESVSSTGLAAESIENLKNRYQDLAGFDAAKLFERTANGIHLNTKELRELEKAYESQKKQKIDTTLDDLIAQYEDLTEQIDEAGTSASTVDLYAQRNDILSQINDTANLKSQYDALTSSFYKWEQAQSIGEEGDMYDSLTGGLEDIKQLYKDGLIGTNKFRSAVQLMTDQDLSNASAGELVEIYEDAYPKMERYFKENSNGVNNFLHDVSKINSEWASMNENGQWEVNIDDFTAVAEELGISAEAVGVIMRKLSDYGFDVDLDMQFADLDTIQTKAEKAASTLKEMGKTSYEFDFNATNIDRVNEQIKVAETTLDQFRNTDGTVNLDLAGAEEAQYVLATLILQKQSLDEASILKIDTGNVDGEIGEVLRQLQTLKTNYNNLELQTAIGADTTQIQTDIDTAIASLSNEHPEILTTLGIDATSQETMLAGINALSPEMIVQAGVDPTLVDEYAAAEHTSTGVVVWSNDKSAVESYASITKRSSGKVRWGNDTDSVKTHFYAKGTIRWTNAAVVNGTAHAYGTAFKNGDWGTKDSGVALGGELGQELVVRDGKFFTIGDNSAEFFKYKKGDVIFNAAQTAEIFSKGKITNATPRGKAYAGGSYGGNATGSLIVNGSVVTSPSGSSSSSGSKKSSGSSSSSSSDDSKIVDWIETAIDRIERAIKKLATTATSAYRTLKKRLGATADEISLVEKELALQEKAHARYLKEANSVSLSSALKEKVHDGTIDISEYSGETAELIEEYQQWYEKALACSDAIDELHESLASLYEEKFNAISTEMDNELSLIEHKLNTFTTGIDGLETKGYLGGTAFYEGMQKAEQESMDILKERYDDLVQAMSDGMNSGEIEKYSESWYAMQAEINETKEQLQEATLATIEYGNSIRDIEWGHFDYLQERISKVTEESERLIDLLSNSDLYGDRGQLSDAGMATLGLRGMNYNTYLAQAERYAEELAEIEADLAKDSNNTALIKRREELLDLQQESILAAESEKQAIVDLVEEGINLELNSLKELIDAYTESLDSAKDLYEFQKKISDQSAEVASLQKQLAAYAGDTSEENRARIQKLQVDLSDAMEELEESQYDQYIKDQKKLLDNFYDDYEATLNKRLDNVDALISDMIDAINVNADDIAATIENAALIAGMSLSDGMASIWNADGTQAVIAQYGDGFTEQLTTLNNFLSGIDQNLASLIGAGDAVADETITNTSTVTEALPAPEKSTTSTEPTTTQTTQTEQTQTQESKKQVKITSGTWHIRAGAGTKYDVIGYAHKGDTFEYLGQSGNWNAVSYKGKKRWIYNSGSKIEGFSKGGWVEGLHEIARKQGDDIVTVNTLKRGEAVLEPKLANGFVKMVGELPALHNLLDTSKTMGRIVGKPVSTGNSIQYGDVHFDMPIQIERVEDYNDLMRKLQSDPKFEKIIQAMTVDQLVGKGRLEKYTTKLR